MLGTLLSLCHVLVGLAFPHLAPGQQKSSKPKRLKMSANRERTFIMLKPDAVHRGIVGDIIKRFEKKGFKLVAMKMMCVSKKDCWPPHVVYDTTFFNRHLRIF